MRERKLKRKDEEKRDKSKNESLKIKPTQSSNHKEGFSQTDQCRRLLSFLHP